MKRSLRIAATAAALALAPAMLHAQTYPITNNTPLAVPVVGPQFVAALTGSPLPSPTTTQACFYVFSEAVTSTPLTIQTGTGVYSGSVTFTVPASYLATIPPADISASGFTEATVYFVPTGSTCTGTANPAYSGTANILIEAPAYVASSTNNLPQTNTALTSASPVLFTVTGQYFAPTTIVQFMIGSSTINATTKYLSQYALQVTSPTITSSSNSADLQVVTIGSQGSYPALSQGELGVYAVRQSSLGTPTVTPNPAGAGATLTFGAVSQDGGADSMQQGGVPTGAITMTEMDSSNATVGSTVTGVLTPNPISTSFTAISGFTDQNTPFNPSTIIGDFNGDGVPDVLVVDEEDSTYFLTVYPGAYPLGDFGSSATTVVPSGCSGVYGLASGDVNGDGVLDLAVLCGDSDLPTLEYVIMLGNGDGTFTYSNTVDTGGANGLALGDFYHHGKLDLAAIGTNTEETATEINLYPGNGDGTFGATTNTFLSNPNLGIPDQPILSTDIDGDGYPDLVLNVGSDVAVLVSNGDGTVGNAAAGTPNYDYSAGFGGGMVDYAAAADVNNDGKTDIIFTGDVNAEFRRAPHAQSSREKMRAAAARRGVLLPVGPKSPAVSRPPLPAATPRSSTGSPNVVKPKTVGPNIVALLNTSTPGAVSFATPVTSTVPAVADEPIAVANFDGDCCNDVLLTDGTNFIVYSGNNAGAFAASDTNLLTPLPSGTIETLAVAGLDLNGDGAADLVYSVEIPGSGSSQYSVNEALTTGSASASTVGNPGLPPGTYTVNYTYNGNALAYTGSTNTLNPLTITTEATTTTLAASQASVVFGQSETLTATIAQGATTSNPPTGTVTFMSGPTLLGSGTVSGSQAVLSGVDLPAGSYTVKATYSGDTDNAGSSGTVSFTVTQATPTLTWAAPSPITYGTALSATQLDATASVSGTYAYTPSAGTVLAVGSHTLSVTFTPADTTDYTTASGTATLFVNASGNTIYSFCTQPSCADGTDPEDSLIQAADGNYYGTVDTGGALGTGAFFRVSSTGQEATLYSFGAQSGDGTMVAAALVQGTDGNFYGATQRGGANGAGTVFQVTPAGTQTTLYSFTADAAGSVSGLVEDSAGNFYGTKAFGGAGSGGTIFKLTPSGSAFTFSTLYPFCSQAACADGNAPFSGLVQGTDGDFYGTTEAGGANNAGTVYKITPGGAFTLLHSFSGSDGQAPYGGLVQGADGNFYGTTRTGGGTSSDGTVFRMTPGGTLTTLYSFSGTDGANPYFAVLALGSDGNFYGTASHGGGANDGTVFQITSGGALTTLHSFCSQASCTDGNYPIGGVVQGSDGNFYGATADGGAASDGAVFEVSPGTLAAPVQLSLSSPSIILGTPVTLSWNSLNAFSGTMQQCAAIILNGATPAAAGNWTGLQSGTLTAGVYSGSASISPTVVGTYTYGLTCGGVESAAPVSLTVNQATPTLTWAAPTAISYGTALSATQLDATASVPGTFVYSPPAGTALPAGTQTLSVTFTPTDTTDYTTANKTVSLTVNQATPTITWAAPSAINYGTALSATQLDATASTAGTFAYTPASGTVLTAGTQTLSVTFTPTDTTDYTTANKTVSLTVNKATPTITWAAPSAITYGTALSATQLDASSGGIAGTFVYTPASGTVLTAGTQTLSVTFTPTDTTDYTTANKTVSLTVHQATPTLTWSNPSAISYGTALSATQLDATASTAGTFVYTPASGTVLTAGTQTLSVTFTPTDTTDYTTANKTVSLTVNQATPTITWAAPSTINYGTALSATQLDATASTAGTFVYTPASGTVLTAGTQTLSVTFTPTDTTDYTTANKTVSLTVTQATPTITWAAPAAISYGTALSATQLDATASTAGTFVYTPASGTVLTAGTQTLSVTFTPTDTTDYTTANKTVSLTVTQATPTITWAAPSTISYGTALSATQLDATASTAGTFVYTPASGTVLTAGTQTLSVKFTPTDATDYTTATKTVSLTVNQATPTITWAAPSAISYGTALSATQLDATASTAGTFAYSPAAGTVLTAGTQTLSVTFTPTDTTDYTTANKTVSLTVNQATPTITWAAPSAISYGTALSATQLDATTSTAGTFVYTPASGTVLTAGTQTLSVTFTPTDTTDYTTANKTVSLTVNQATPTITWAAPSAISYGTALSATQLDATASIAGSFVYTPASGTVLTAGAHTLSVTFTPTDTTDYTTANKTVSLTVNQATPTITWAAPAPISYGTALSATQLDATASVGGTFVYTPASGTVLTAGTQTLSVTFTPTDTTDYTTATKTVSLTVNQATPTVTWAAPASIAYGTALSATQLDATATGVSGTLAGTFAYTPAAGTVLTAGTQTLSVTFTPTDATDYSTATKTVSLTVNKTTPGITWSNPAAIAYGTALSATQLDATATGISGSLPGTFVYTPPSGTILTAGTQTLSVTFTPTDTTDYTTATKSVSLTVSQATPTLTWATPAPIAYGTALSATQLDATASVAGTFVYTPAAGTVLATGTQTLSVTFTPTDTTDYTTATKSVSLSVGQTTPTLTWAAPASIAYGTALSATQLDATASVGGTFVYTPAAGTVLTAGTQTLSVTFTPTDTTDYTTATKTVSITVAQATPALTWAAPASIAYGTALSATQLDATAAGVSGTLAGTFAYTPAAGTVLTAGTHTLSVTFTPTDTTDYTTATKTVSITVTQATPTLTWTAPAAITYGTALSATQLDATATGVSGTLAGTFAYTPATGTVLTAGSHTLSVTFTPTDTTDYTTATKTVSITVNQATPTLTWTAPSAIAYGTALSATQLDATAAGVSGTLAGTFVYTPTSGTVLTAGTQTLSVTFTPTDTTDYTTATKTVSLTVTQATPTVNWNPPPAIPYGTPLSATQLDANATGIGGSALAGTFTYNPPAGTVLTAGTQTLSVTFTPTDSTDYTVATGSITLGVSKVTPTVTWTAPAAVPYGTLLSATQLNATATGINGALAGTFAYNPPAGTLLTAGTHALQVIFTPTDTTDYTNSNGGVSITVNQTAPTLTWTAPSAITYGTALSATQLNATAAGVSGTLAGTFVYTPATGTVLTAGSHTLSVTFTPTDATDYTTATTTVSITVNQAALTVTANNLSIEQGQAIPALTYAITGFKNGDTQASSTTGAPSLSTTATQSSPAGAYPITPVINTLAATNYTFSFVDGTLTITAFSIGSLSSDSIAAGSSAATITLTGSGFTANDVVLVNGTAISTTYNGPTSLTATIPASYLTTANTTLQIAVKDDSTGVTTASTPFVVGPSVLAVTTPILPNITVNTAYTATLAATGGVTPYTWSITSGALPAGLTLDANTGGISGTPTAIGTPSFTVQAKDSETTPMTATSVLAIGVNATQSLVYDFCLKNTACPDGDGPTELIQADDGNFYGVTEAGGANSQGTLYQLTPAGAETVLYSFCGQGGASCTDGATPVSLVLGSDGNFYGVTTIGGAYNYGSIFKATPAGALTTLYSFCSAQSDTCSDGAYPEIQLTLGSDGNFYGVTTQAGANAAGTAFKITPGGTFTLLYTFIGGMYGGSPNGLTQASDGNFYGVAQTGGFTSSGCTSATCGTIFQLTPAGALTTIYSFCPPAASSCPDGYFPIGVLNEGPDGNLYGATQYGGSNGAGTVFKVTTAGTLTDLYNFCTGGGTTLCNPETGNPQNGITVGTDGNFYGASGTGGNTTGSDGAAFQLTSAGALTTVYNFCTLTNCNDGSFPATPPVQGNDGNFYGTATDGGSTNGPDNVGGGVIYKLSGGGLQAPVQMTLSSATAAYGTPVTLSWQVLNAFSTTAQQCYAYVVSGGATAGTWTGLQSGTLNAGVYSGSATIAPTAGGTYQYGMTCGGVESALPVTLAVTPESTTTGLTPSNYDPSYGETISLTAAISPANPGGATSTANVSFYDGATLLGTVASSGFAATLPSVALSAGAHSLSAVFAGDSNYQTSTGTESLTVYPAVLIASANNLSMQQGAAVPTLTYSITGFQYSDTQATATTGAPLLATTATSSSPPGNYPISIMQGTLAAANYVFNLMYGTLTVNANMLSITTSTLPVGKTGTAYSTTLAASGGVAPYSWSVTTGALPAGLQLNATTGVISGTPTAAGAINFTITVTDSESTPMTAFVQFSISINSSENILDAFCQTTGCPDGENPRDGVIQASDGNFYGTTAFDGANNGGTVFKITPSGTLTTLYNFCSLTNCADGSQPKGLREAADGNFYSVTLSGGITNGGTVFKITPAGVFTLLYQFCTLMDCTDGETPTDVLLPGSDGNFYGTTGYGGENENGTVFKITPTGTLTTLYSFCAQSACADGAVPPAGLIQGADDSYYGVTSSGGANSSGTVFKIDPKGNLTTLYSFCAQTNCADGSLPNSNLAQGSDGNFYGVTQSGGNETSKGIVFNMTPAGALTTLYQFCTLANCADGAQPSVGMVLGSDGNFYGTTQASGAGNEGTFFQLAPVIGPSGTTYTVNTLYSFCTLTNCADGSTPEGFIQANDGNFYGTAEYGGNANNAGLVYQLPNSPALAAPVQLSLSASTVTYGGSVTLSWQVLNAFSTTAQQCYAFINSGAATGGIWTGVQSGTLTSGIYSGSATLTPTAVGTYSYALTCGGVESGLTGTLTVTPAVLTVSANNVTIEQGQAIPTLSYAITGFQNGDMQATATTGAPTLSTTATQSSAPNTYPITVAQGTLAATNYTFSFVPGTLTITPFSVSSLSPNSVPTGSPNTVVTLTGQGFSEGDNVLVNGSPLTTTYNSPTSLSATIPAADLTTMTTLQIAVMDTATGVTTAAAPFGVGPAVVAVTTTSLPSDTVNVAYTSTTLAATGGVAPYTWSVTQGALPAGLSLAQATGIISGTPTTVGVAAFTVKVTDSETTPMTATASLTLAVNAAESVLYNFCSLSGCADGDQPTSGVVQANDGNFYGTADFGGANNDGTVFRLTPSGTYTTLYSFCSQPNCNDGSTPIAGLVQSGNGNFYGITETGGAIGDGVFFNITPSGAINTLYYFCSLAKCADGELPEYSLVQGSDGNFYGVTTQGGSKDDGTVFKVTPSGALTTLYSFCSLTSCTDGSAPQAGLVQGTDGNFYGTTTAGGANNKGTVFNITPSGTLTTLYSFCSLANCADGYTPRAALVEGVDGNFYGTTYEGGSSSNPNGTVFKVTPAGTLTTLYSFCSLANCVDGINPQAGLVQGSDGNFYGATPSGGASSNDGTVFQITPSGTLTTLYSFCSVTNCTDASFPQASLVQGSDGNFYSTAETGGSGVVSGAGAVYKISPSPALAAPVQLTLSSTSAPLGTPVTLSWQVLNAFSTTLQQCYAFVLNSATTAGTWTGLQTGTLASGVYSGSASITPTATGTYQYGFTCGGVESAAPVSLTVTGATVIATTTALTSSATSPVYGTPISLTATITPSNPSGPASTANVSFYDGATLLGTVANNGFTATLTGVQLAAGTQSLSAVYAGDSNYQTSTGTLSLTVTPAVLTVTANNLTKALGAANPTLTYTLTGFQYSDTQATATTGAPALSTTATTTSPAGAYPITLTQGTLAAANYTFTLINGTLTVTGNALTLDTTSLPIGKVGVAYSATLTASGGITPYTWSISVGSLPAGLSLDASTGVISGKPTAPGVQTFTVQVADSESTPAIQAVPLSIAVNSNEAIIAALCAQTGCPDGSDPRNAVIETSDGNLYGTAYEGGADNDGTIFKISPTGALSLLYTFCTQTGCPDGELPQGLVEGPGGALYGTTFGAMTGAGMVRRPSPKAGSSNFGTVFRITTAGTLTTLYSFCSQGGSCTDGQGPGNLTVGSDGNLYGATGLGGANGNGSLFKITPAGTFTQLYSFCATAGCPDGSLPSAGLMQASDGNFYGVTSFGGSQNSGALYKLTPAGAVSTLYSFCQLNDCVDGSAPDSVLVQGANGDLYGATSTGGSTDDGALFDIALNGTFTLLDSFTGANGNSPNDLLLGSDGNFYGTTPSLGEGNGGTFFELTPAGALTTLYTFCSQPNCADGGTPEGLLQASDGNLYGTASTGADNGGGAIVQLPITPPLPAPVQLALSASSVTAGTPVTLTFNVLNAFSTTLQQCYAFVRNAATGAGSWTGIQTGTVTSGVYTGTASITPTAPGTYTYALTCGGVESGASPVLTVTPSQAGFTLTSISPNTTNIGAANTTITLIGTGFTPADQAQVNGVSIATTLIDKVTLTAIIPAADLATSGTLQISVFDPAGNVSTNTLPFTVTVPPVGITFSGPSTATSASQPDLTFNLTNPYPVELTATLTLTFEGAAGVDDPNIVFANGSRTFSFNIAANTTATPTIALQTGTDAGAISITLSSIVITSSGQDITPAVAPVVITIPAEAPAITSMTLVRSGNTITANIMGYSNTRDMTEAAFTFTSAAAIDDPDITVPETALFGGWYSTAPSDAFGSEFLYTQAFTLNDDSSNISQVTVTLTNSAGTSSSATAQ